jgi:hypothetical protein
VNNTPKKEKTTKKPVPKILDNTLKQAEQQGKHPSKILSPKEKTQ